MTPIDVDAWYVIKPEARGQFALDLGIGAQPTEAKALEKARDRGYADNSVISGAELASLGFDG